ncbi:MAG: hypothetical protein AAF928_01175 [Myxococcota bacterium]
MADPSPSAERGSFEQISFALLLIRALDKRWSGIVRIQPDDDGDPHLLELDRGLVCRVLVPDGFARLGEVVVEAGVIMANELEAALAREGRLGAALIEAKLIDEKTLQRALVLQLLKRLVRCFTFPPSVVWTFEPNRTPFEGMPPGVRIDTLRVLWAGLSQHDEMGGWREHTLERIGASTFTVRSDVNLKRFGFTGDARRLVRVIRDERNGLRDLVERGLAPEKILRTIVYVLAITRHLDFAPAGGSATLSGTQIEESDASMFDETTSSEGSVPPSAASSGRRDGAVAPAAVSRGEEGAPEARTLETADRPSESGDTPSSDAAGSDTEPSEARASGPGAGKKPRRVAKIKLRRVARARAAAPDLPGTGEHRTRGARPARPPSDVDAVATASTEPAIDFHAQLQRDVRARLRRLPRETPFEHLGLDPASLEGKSEDEITEMAWAALDRLSKRWHPDTSTDEHEGLREDMGKIHGALVEAFETIIDPKRRADALGEVRRGRGGRDAMAHLSETLVSATADSAPAGTKDAAQAAKATPPSADLAEAASASSAPGSSSGGSSSGPPAPIVAPGANPEAPAGSAAGVAADDDDHAEIPTGKPERAVAPPSSGERTAAKVGSKAKRTKGRFDAPSARSTALHERALVAFAEEKLTEALRLARLACQEAPDHPDYAATAAWVRANMPSAPLARLLSHLDRVLRDHPEHVSARYYRGVLRARQNEPEGARADFEHVLTLDAEHDGAAGQLAQLRATRSKSSRESG